MTTLRSCVYSVTYLQNHFLFTLSTWNPIHDHVHKIGKALQSKMWHVCKSQGLRQIKALNDRMKSSCVLKTFSAQILSHFLVSLFVLGEIRKFIMLFRFVQPAIAKNVYFFPWPGSSYSQKMVRATIHKFLESFRFCIQCTLEKAAEK